MMKDNHKKKCMDFYWQNAWEICPEYQLLEQHKRKGNGWEKSTFNIHFKKTIKQTPGIQLCKNCGTFTTSSGSIFHAIISDKRYNFHRV